MQNETTHEDALRALDAVARTRADMAADLGECPAWRHAAFAALMAALVGSIAISNTAQIVATPLILLAVFAIMRSDRQRLGVFVSGYRRGRTLKVTIFLLVLMAAGVVAAMTLRDNDATMLAKAALAGGAFIASYGLSVVWQRVFRSELIDGAQV